MASWLQYALRPHSRMSLLLLLCRFFFYAASAMLIGMSLLLLRLGLGSAVGGLLHMLEEQVLFRACRRLAEHVARCWRVFTELKVAYSSSSRPHTLRLAAHVERC